MSSTLLIIVIVVILLVLAALVTLGALRSARTRRLRSRFGPEYDRAAEAAPDRNAAENELRDRERRHADLDIRPLDPASRDRYAREWTAVQERFVDAPGRSIHEADLLVADLMRERGYPVENFDQQAADLSVRHGHTLGHYRQAHDIAAHVAAGETDTEQMRQAMVHYREMFADLLSDDPREDSGEPGTTPREGIGERVRDALHPGHDGAHASRKDRP